MPAKASSIGPPRLRPRQTVDSDWLYESDYATPAMIVTHLWQQVGLMMVLLLLGLNAHARPIRSRRRRIDGASRWQVFRHIVLPLLAPTCWW